MARHRSFDYEQARRLLAEGASLDMIGQRFGVTPAAACYAIRQAGRPARSRTYDHELIRRLDSEGVTQAEIARRIGCTAACVSYVLGRARCAGRAGRSDTATGFSAPGWILRKSGSGLPTPPDGAAGGNNSL